MDVTVNLVSALTQMSAFQFFLGLADFLFEIDTATATTTSIVSVICAHSVVISSSQSRYESPLSGISGT
jgi:hypothetical protein